MKTIFMGTPEFAVPSLEKVFESTELAAIFTKADKPNARGNKIIVSPVKQFGIEHNIEIIQPHKLKDSDLIKKIKDLAPDLIVVVAYGKIIPREIIDIPKYGIINVHSSLLPKYRGASPIHSAVLNGDKETGVSIMYIEEELDAGDVILMESCEITETDTLGTLHDKLKVIGAELLGKALSLIEKEEVSSTPQDHTKATFVKPITKEEEKIDWSRSAEEVYNKIRGLNPFPGAYTTFKDTVVKIYETEKDYEEYEGDFGEIVALKKKHGPVVKLRDGNLILKNVKLQGKKNQSGIDLLNGRVFQTGDKFI